VAGFGSVKQAINYCGLCGAERSSADMVKRMPISKQRNKHLRLALVYEAEKQKGHANRATVAVARLVVPVLSISCRMETS
jgi:transposase